MKKLLYIITTILTFIILTCSASEKEKLYIDIFLNNNPECKTMLENIAKAQKWSISNKPCIIIKGYNFQNGRELMKIVFEEQLISEKEIIIKNQRFETKVELSDPLKNPKEFEIKIGNDFSQKIPVELKRLYGKVTYFGGKPVSNPIIVTTNISAVGDKEGNFEIYLFEKVKNILIFEKNYSKSTLECYLWDVDLKKDTKLDIKIDKLEVYRLHAWEGEMSLYLHFIPMSVTRAAKISKEFAGDEYKIASAPNIWPDLEKEDVKVFIDDKEFPILTFAEHADYLFQKDGENINRQGYLLSVPKENFKGKIIKVQIQDTVRKNNKKIIEKGEGYYFGFY